MVHENWFHSVMFQDTPVPSTYIWLERNVSYAVFKKRISGCSKYNVSLDTERFQECLFFFYLFSWTVPCFCLWSIQTKQYRTPPLPLFELSPDPLDPNSTTGGWMGSTAPPLPKADTRIQKHNGPTTLLGPPKIKKGGWSTFLLSRSTAAWRKLETLGWNNIK